MPQPTPWGGEQYSSGPGFQPEPEEKGFALSPLVAAAGLSSASGLLQMLMGRQQAQEQAQAALEAEERARKEREAREKRDRLAQAEQNQLSQINAMGQGEQSALGNLLAVLARSAR